MPGSGGVEPKGAIPEKGKNVGLSIMGYRFAPGSTFLHSHPRRRLQRVTANYVLATAGAHLPSACHCAPVRTLVRQSVSPQGNLASWLLFRQIRIRFSVIRFRYRFLPCSTARSTDCRVAPLLAMTGGGVIAPHAPAFCMSLQNTPLQPQQRLCLLHVIANQCAHWCGNPFPRRET